MVRMFLYGNSAIPSLKESELMGIQGDTIYPIPIDELHGYIPTVKEKRNALFLQEDEGMFVANGLLKAMVDLQRHQSYEAQVIPFNRWSLMGEEPAGPLA